MSEWKEYRLGEVASVQTGPFGSQLHQKDYVIIGTPIITVEHLGDNRITYQNLPKVSDTDKQRLKKYHLQEGDVVFSRVGSVDRRALVTKKENGWLFSGRCLRVRGTENKADGAFLSYYFGQESFKEYVRRIAVGATMPSINTTILSEIVIKIPSLQAQTAIAEILSSLDDKIELNNKINQELETLAQTLFKQWFIDFEFPNENGEPYKSSGGEMVESELGEIPKGWEVGKFGDLVKVINGFAFKSVDFNDFSSEGIIKIKNINGTIVDIVNTDFVSNEVTRKLNDKFKIESGDILVAMTGAEVGKIGVVAKTQKSLWLNQRVGKILPNNIYHLSYIHTMFNVLNLTEVIRNEAMGSAQPNISSQGIESIKLLIPQTTLINEFSSLFNDKFILFYDSLAENQELTNLRDTLLPKLISGELTLNEISNQ
jgi:type I restriction enzyme S subunit